MPIDKIRKLLRLARDKGASESEAASALALAQKLMLQYNIDHIDDAVEERKAIEGEWMHVRRDDKWEITIAWAVATLYNCLNVFMPHQGSHRFVGKRENVAASEITFVWVCEQIEDLYRQGLKVFKVGTGALSKRQRADFRRSFKEGCARRVSHRVNEIVAAARKSVPDHLALVVIDQSLAEANDLVKGLRTRKTQGWRSGAGSGAGYAAGDAVKLQGDVPGGRKLLK